MENLFGAAMVIVGGFSVREGGESQRSAPAQVQGLARGSEGGRHATVAQIGPGECLLDYGVLVRQARTVLQILDGALELAGIRVDAGEALGEDGGPGVETTGALQAGDGDLIAAAGRHEEAEPLVSHGVVRD